VLSFLAPVEPVLITILCGVSLFVCRSQMALTQSVRQRQLRLKSERIAVSVGMFRVASFNILAKEFATEDSHGHAPAHFRDWKHRRPLIREMLTRLNAGV